MHRYQLSYNHRGWIVEVPSAIRVSVIRIQERSSSNVMVGVGMLVFGFAGSALCIYSWCKALRCFW